MSTYAFSNRDYRKRSSDGRQKKGGKVYKQIQLRNAGLNKLGVPRPRPGAHAVMRKKGIEGPMLGTRARKKWAQKRTLEGTSKRQ